MNVLANVGSENRHKSEFNCDKILGRLYDYSTSHYLSDKKKQQKTGNGQSKYCVNGPKFSHVVTSLEVFLMKRF